MATLTIRNLPDDVVDRLKEAAARRAHSMEQEVRELLEARYASKGELIARIEDRWRRHPKASAEEIRSWIREGRP
jgi:hypothetical protein